MRCSHDFPLEGTSTRLEKIREPYVQRGRKERRSIFYRALLGYYLLKRNYKKHQIIIIIKWFEKNILSIKEQSIECNILVPRFITPAFILLGVFLFLSLFIFRHWKIRRRNYSPVPMGMKVGRGVFTFVVNVIRAVTSEARVRKVANSYDTLHVRPVTRSARRMFIAKKRSAD